MQELHSIAMLLGTPPSGLVLGTKLGTVKLTPGEGPKHPRYSKDCERDRRANGIKARVHQESRRRAASWT